MFFLFFLQLYLHTSRTLFAINLYAGDAPKSDCEGIELLFALDHRIVANRNAQPSYECEAARVAACRKRELPRDGLSTLLTLSIARNVS